MKLYDFGNTNVTIYDNGKISKILASKFEQVTPSQSVYYISVNEKISLALEKNPYYTNLDSYFKFDTIYQGMGIDRVAACYSVSDGVVVDAGTAITVDIMHQGSHLGGFIMPGITASLSVYEGISPRLKKPFNSFVALDCMPEKTADAISYGIVKPLVLAINDVAKDKKIYMTGGDGRYLSKFFDRCIFDLSLSFRGMLKAIQENKELL